MKTKLYLTRRADFFQAAALGIIPVGSIQSAGSIWVTLALTEKQAKEYGEWFGISVY